MSGECGIVLTFYKSFLCGVLWTSNSAMQIPERPVSVTVFGRSTTGLPDRTMSCAGEAKGYNPRRSEHNNAL